MAASSDTSYSLRHSGCSAKEWGQWRGSNALPSLSAIDSPPADTLLEDFDRVLTVSISAVKATRTYEMKCPATFNNVAA